MSLTVDELHLTFAGAPLDQPSAERIARLVCAHLAELEVSPVHIRALSVRVDLSELPELGEALLSRRCAARVALAVQRSYTRIAS